jgi:hypothetical protein
MGEVERPLGGIATGECWICHPIGGRACPSCLNPVARAHRLAVSPELNKDSLLEKATKREVHR